MRFERDSMEVREDESRCSARPESGGPVKEGLGIRDWKLVLLSRASKPENQSRDEDEGDNGTDERNAPQSLIPNT